MTPTVRTRHPWLLYLLLGVGVAAVITLAVTSLGVSKTSARTTSETVTATNGVVQETASGSGNVEAGVDDQVSFETSGTLEAVYVKVGQKVTRGQLLAKLNPTSAELTLDEAEATLTQAQDTLTAAEDTTTSSTTSSSGTSTTATTSTTSAASTAATLATDRAQVASDQATVTADEKAVTETRLYAPASGTIATLSSDAIGTQEGSSSSGASSSTSGTSTTSGASSASSTAAGSLGSSSTTSSTADSSGFAEIVNTDTLTMTVAFSESDIDSIKVGQAATVTLSALSGVELAGKVTAISPVGSSSDSVVSYDATITVGQSTSKVMSGMSATATVITRSESGVTVPSDAVSGDTVQLVRNGRATAQAVTVGLTGTDRDVITSGLSAGDELKVTATLPSLGSSTSTTSSSSASSAAGALGGTGSGAAGPGAGGFSGAPGGGFGAGG